MRRVLYILSGLIAFWAVGVILTALEQPEAGFWFWVWAGLGGMSLLGLMILLVVAGVVLFIMGIFKDG